MVNDITQIVEVPYLNGTPARVNHRTGVMEISRQHFRKLDPIYRLFIMLHERGHIALNTKNEYAADEYAMNELLKRGYPLTKILESLTRVLQFNKQDHYGRSEAMLQKLRAYDYHINGNKKVLTNFSKNMNTPNIYAADVYDQSLDQSNFLGGLLGAIPGVSNIVSGVLGGLTGGGGNNAAAQQAQAAAAQAQAQAQAQQAQIQMMQMQQQQQQAALAAANKKDESFMDKYGTVVIIVVVLIIAIVAFIMLRKKK